MVQLARHQAAEARGGGGATSTTSSRDLDRRIGVRLRRRRLELGLTQQQVAELIGVTCQQAHKYETGANRIAANRLPGVARALGVEPGYFFEGLGMEGPPAPTARQRLLLELARSFAAIRSPRHREALCEMVRTVADATEGADPPREGALDEAA